MPSGDVGIANFSACQDVLWRVDKTFKAFFRRVKAAALKVGYPRFRSRYRYDSLTWPSWGDGCTLRPSGRLYLQGVGDLKVKWHRALPESATIKTVSVKREAGHWYVCLSLALPEPEPLPCNDLAVGIDVGLTTFAVLSNGAEIANPRHSAWLNAGSESPNPSVARIIAGALELRGQTETGPRYIVKNRLRRRALALMPRRHSRREAHRHRPASGSRRSLGRWLRVFGILTRNEATTIHEAEFALAEWWRDFVFYGRHFHHHPGGAKPIVH